MNRGRAHAWTIHSLIDNLENLNDGSDSREVKLLMDLIGGSFEPQAKITLKSDAYRIPL